MGNVMVNALIAAGVVFAIGYGWIAHLRTGAGGARVSGPEVMAVVVAPTPTWGQATASRWEAGSPATVRGARPTAAAVPAAMAAAVAGTAEVAAMVVEAVAATSSATILINRNTWF